MQLKFLIYLNFSIFILFIELTKCQSESLLDFPKADSFQQKTDNLSIKQPSSEVTVANSSTSEVTVVNSSATETSVANSLASEVTVANTLASEVTVANSSDSEVTVASVSLEDAPETNTSTFSSVKKNEGRIHPPYKNLNFLNKINEFTDRIDFKINVNQTNENATRNSGHSGSTEFHTDVTTTFNLNSDTVSQTNVRNILTSQKNLNPESAITLVEKHPQLEELVDKYAQLDELVEKHAKLEDMEDKYIESSLEAPTIILSENIEKHSHSITTEEDMLDLAENSPQYFTTSSTVITNTDPGDRRTTPLDVNLENVTYDTFASKKSIISGNALISKIVVPQVLVEDEISEQIKTIQHLNKTEKKTINGSEDVVHSSNGVIHVQSQSAADAYKVQNSLPASAVHENLSEYNTTKYKTIPIHKCCGEFQFFSSYSFDCREINDTSKFYKSVNTIIYNTKKTNIELQSSRITSCPGNNEPPSIVSDISNSTHSILSSGNILDSFTNNTYNHSNYCLEIIGTDVESGTLTLVFCPKIVQDTLFKHLFKPEKELIDAFTFIHSANKTKNLYYQSTADVTKVENSSQTSALHANHANYNNKGHETVTLHKCCEGFQFFNTTSLRCKKINNTSVFYKSVITIINNTQKANTKHISSQITSCPETNGHSSIIVSNISNNTPTNFSPQDIIELLKLNPFNPTKYCVEITGTDVEFGTINLAFCPNTPDLLEKNTPIHYFLKPEKDASFSLKEIKHSANETNQIYTDSITYVTRAKQHSPASTPLEYLPNNYTAEHETITVHKCCDEYQFFSTATFDCQEINDVSIFYKSIITIMNNIQQDNIKLLSSRITSCPGTVEPPSIVSDISNTTHAILPSGNILDLFTHDIYNQSDYCVEIIGNDVESGTLTLAFCPNIPEVIEQTTPFHHLLKLEKDAMFSSKEINYSTNKTNAIYTPSTGDVTRAEQSSPVSISLKDASNNNILEHASVTVHKCCGEYQFFNTASLDCQDINDASVFYKPVITIIHNIQRRNIKLLSSRITSCPGTTEPPSIVFNISNNTHAILPSGNILDLYTHITYNLSDYCVEIIGKELESGSLALAFCPNISEVYEQNTPFKHFLKPEKDAMFSSKENNNNRNKTNEIYTPSSVDVNRAEKSSSVSRDDSSNTETSEHDTITVHKCCGEYQFFSTATFDCQEINDVSVFYKSIITITHNILPDNIKLLSSRITSCPGTVEPPSIVSDISNTTHAILPSGNILDLFTNDIYNHSDYCVEIIGNDVESGTLTLAFCPNIPEVFEQTTLFQHLLNPEKDAMFSSKEINHSTNESNEIYTPSTVDVTRAEKSSPASIFLEDASYNNTLKHESVTVHKCCGEYQFFSISSFDCQDINDPSVFYKSVITIVNNIQTDNIKLLSSRITSCPETNESPSIMSDISNSTHTIFPSGDILDLSTHSTFNLSDYCIEIIGADVESGKLTLAFCPKLPVTEYDYDYFDSTESPNSDTEEFQYEDENHHLVRKCCKQNEYYDSSLHKCTVIKDSDHFNLAVEGLSFENTGIELKIISSRINECGKQSAQPNVIPITNSTHRLRHNGELININTGVHLNYSHYCLEMVGSEPGQLSLTLAFCPETYVIPKCCQQSQYFDQILLDCLPIPLDWNGSHEILQSFKMDSEDYTIVPPEYFLQCQNGFPVKESAARFSIKKGLLCNHRTCFETHQYCIDYLDENNPIAFYCPKEFFAKCCMEGQKLSVDGCVESEGGNSVLLRHLLNTRSFINNFDIKQCQNNNGYLIDERLSSYVHWWVSADGQYLSVKSDETSIKIEHYCIDDFVDHNEKVVPSAYVCESEVSHLLPNDEHFHQSYSAKGSLGKCCPENPDNDWIYYFSRANGKCVLKQLNETLRKNEYLKSASFTSEHFHDFPQCPNNVSEYHAFPFNPGPYDHASITSTGALQIISKEGNCIQRVDNVKKERDYCIEYVLTEEGDIKVSAFLCAYAPVIDAFQEKFILVTALLGVSCACLFITLIYLFMMRVRRGLITVRKVNTLAGKILVSFVLSHLLGFIALSLTQHGNYLNIVSSPGCFVLAGFIQFFNLATFCWNTSICLESLLLTIHINISEWLRYCFHSLWAWGFPLTMTILMFVMDHYREQLPCGVITPKIGVYHCFHSSNDALLVYFYVPILITLIANISFLFGAKSMRTARLKRLERGKPTPGQMVESQTNSDSAQTHSGMRTHQNQNIKVESVRIVLWTGGTWFLELAGFVITRYLLTPSGENWYEYLWYIPTSVNSLRGIGVMAIIVLTPEMRKEIKNYTKRIKTNFRTKYRSFRKTFRSTETRSETNDSMKTRSVNEERKRNMSVTTMISTISSSFYNASSFHSRNHDGSKRKSSIGSFFSSKMATLRRLSSGHNDQNQNTSAVDINTTPHHTEFPLKHKPSRKIGMVRSVSQIERRASVISNGSIPEEVEVHSNSVHRKYSAHDFSLHLPKLYEEESVSDSEVNKDETLSDTIKSEVLASNQTTLIIESTNQNNIGNEAATEEALDDCSEVIESPDESEPEQENLEIAAATNDLSNDKNEPEKAHKFEERENIQNMTQHSFSESSA